MSDTFVPAQLSSVDGDDYIFQPCTQCGKLYEKSIFATSSQHDPGRPVRHQWHCICGQVNPMIYHSDDCPCTRGATCEHVDLFEDFSKEIERKNSSCMT